MNHRIKSLSGTSSQGFMAVHAADLGLLIGAGDGIEPALSAWEVSSAIRGLCAETLICGMLAGLARSDRESPLGLTRSARGGRGELANGGRPGGLVQLHPG